MQLIPAVWRSRPSCRLSAPASYAIRSSTGGSSPAATIAASIGASLLQGVSLPYVALLGHHFGRWRGHLYVAFTLSAGERGSRRQTCDQGSQYEPPCLSSTSSVKGKCDATVAHGRSKRQRTDGGMAPRTVFRYVRLTGTLWPPVTRNTVRSSSRNTAAT